MKINVRWMAPSRVVLPTRIVCLRTDQFGCFQFPLRLPFAQSVILPTYSYGDAVCIRFLPVQLICAFFRLFMAMRTPLGDSKPWSKTGSQYFEAGHHSRCCGMAMAGF